MREEMPRLALLLLITGIGGCLLFWLGYEPPVSAAGWVGAGIAFFVWMMLLLGAFGRQIVRFFRILLGWS